MEDGFLTRDMQGFKGGLDYSSPPESIPDYCAIELSNCEFSVEDGGLQTVPGVRPVLELGPENEITCLFYNKARKEYYFAVGGKLNRTTDFTSHSEIGTLSGKGVCHFAMFGTTCLVASGGCLQYISDEGVLTNVVGSPEKCDGVSVRTGRVITFSTDSDLLRYSGVGDYTAWQNTPTDPSTAQSVNVGYKDSGALIAVDFLSSAVIAYKEAGQAYKIVGEPGDSDFACLPISQTAYCADPDATLSIDGKAYYLGRAGFLSFTPTNAYGDIAPFDEGLNVNAALVNNIDSNCRLWHIPSRKQIWIKPQKDSPVYIYHYVPRSSDGRGVFTTRHFIHDIYDVVDDGNHVYIAYGHKIGVLDASLDTDDGEQIVTRIVGANRLAPEHFILVMKYLLVTHNNIAGEGNVKVGRKAKPVTFECGNLSVDKATGGVMYATDCIVSDDYSRWFKVGGGSNRNVQPEITVTKGAVSIRQFHYKYLEV